MSRQQAEQILKERKGKTYDPWIVDRFLTILDQLEASDQAEITASAGSGPTSPARIQLDAITATTAEEREFNELKRDLPRATSLAEAGEILFKHLKRVLPLATMALYKPKHDSNEVEVVCASGVGASALMELSVPIAERVSGWVFAHTQPVLNSDAILELGPVARTFATPLRYVAAVPVMDSHIVGVLCVFGADPFEKDHKRLLENASTLFVSSLAQPIQTEAAGVRGAGALQPQPVRSRVH